MVRYISEGVTNTVWPLSTSGIRDFFSFSVWAHFLASAIAQKILFGILIRIFQLTFNAVYMVTYTLLSSYCSSVNM